MPDTTHVEVPYEKLPDVYRVLTGDYEVISKERLAFLTEPRTSTHAAKLENLAVQYGSTRLADPEVQEAQSAVNEMRVARAEAALLKTIPEASEDEVLDADNWPWRADLHAGSKGKTKDGLWRMKNGVERPPARPAPEAAVAETISTVQLTDDEIAELSVQEPAVEDGQTYSEEAPEPIDTRQVPSMDQDDEDEDEAWVTAAAEVAEETVDLVVPARIWTDQDLGKACSQAANALGGPDAVRALLGDFVPAGDMPHSRNIPEADRPRFIEQLEKLASITVEG